MEHIIITVSSDGKKCHLKPELGFMLQRGVNPNLYSEAVVKESDVRHFSAVKI